MLKQETTGALKRALANLAANLMLVVRGAGKPCQVTEHIKEQPGPDLPGLELPSLVLPESRSEAALKAALQLVATSLIGQERQHNDALNDLDRLLDANRRLLRDKARQRAQRLATKSKPQKRG